MPSSTTEKTRSGRVPGARAALVWGVIATALVTVATIGVFLVAPEDADQGVIQRIFYFHVAIALVSLVAFAVVTETIFAWPGMGKLLIDSINVLDRPVVVAYLCVTVTLFVLINLAVDLAYAALDPRVRLGGEAR